MMAKKTLNQLRNDLTRLSMRIDQLANAYQVRLDRIKRDKEILEGMKEDLQSMKEEREELRESIHEMEEEAWQ
jgi:uncharacterized coiled-coil DUF342 family protein